ncbi:hypothetical protein FRC10_000991 [Ceratobasidium sp. 414]|nr:hypothetical protein FRC10_000991 [Ceratobasidium sp. 414]
MEAKLKALKVAELKEILTKSGTPIGSKANKADLIAKILAAPAALELAGGGNAEEAAEPAATGGDDDLVGADAMWANRFDWEGGADAKGAAPAEATGTTTAEAEPAPTTEAAAPSTEAAGEPASATATSTAPDTETATSEAPQLTEDVERERRKARAARFNVPYVEPAAAPAAKAPRAPRSKGRPDPPVKQGDKKVAADAGKPAEGGAGNKKAEGKKAEGKKAEGKKVDEPKPPKISAKEAAPNDDDAKLAARAARFNISTPATAGGSAADPADEEKKKKREARFGAPNAKKAKTDAQ